MLSSSDKEQLTRVGPGTPMGSMMREYWMPALVSSELPEPDCDPVRALLLGERFISFRDSSGSVGMLSAGCPHRGASLAAGPHSARHMKPWWASGAPARPPGPSSFRVERRGRRPRAKWWPWRVRNVPGLNAVHRAEDFGKPSSRREWMLMPLAPPSTETGYQWHRRLSARPQRRSPPTRR
jgi:hypothetical protein